MLTFWLMARVICKPSVRFGGFTVALVLILHALVRVAADERSVEEIVVTAGSDGSHMNGSRHYSFEAIDVRTKNFPYRGAAEVFAAALRGKLGPQFTVLFENAGTPNEHLHVQPKKGEFIL